MGLFALALPLLTWWQAALCALAAFCHNWIVLPRIVGHRMSSDRVGASDRGVLLYPLIVGAMILTFWRDLSVAAVGWGFLAFGDAAAGVAGMKWGRVGLPWNQKKTWAGLAGGFLGALVGGSLVYVAFVTHVFSSSRWNEWSSGDVARGLVACITLAAAVYALVESAPLAVDDNLLAPVLGALAFVALRGGAAIDSWPTQLTEAGSLVLPLAVNGLCAVLAAWKRVLSPAGIVAAFFLGFVTWSFGSARLWLVLLVFLLAGTLVTRIGWQRKSALGIAEEHEGRRGLGNVASKGTLVFAAAALTPFADARLCTAMAVAALAAALADTAGSEIGKAFGRRTYALPGLRHVPAGTRGAVSVAGTLASVLAAVALVEIARFLALVDWHGALVCSSVGVLAALVEGRFPREAGHDAVNLTLTLVAAAVAGATLVLLGW
jgi:uncharacterized protein (TIGR00297 family)